MIVVSIIALAISAGSLLFTAWAARTAAKQAASAAAQTAVQMEQVAAAREQTQLQREIARDAAQPYVWADIQPDMQQGTAMQLVVGNSGPTVAQNVRITVDPQLPSSESHAEKVLRTQEVLSEGLKSLAPGRTLGNGHELLASEAPQLRTLRVEADGPFGALPAMEIEIDISQIRLSRDAPDGSLHHVRSSIKDLTKAVRDIDSTLNRVADEGRSGLSWLIAVEGVVGV